MADFTQIWTEKYRPSSLEDIVNQKHIVSRLKAFSKDGSIPHMLFAGPPGVGKTAAAIALTRGVFGENWRDNYLELNASDERGIDIVRVKIKDFARTRSMSGQFKLIFLDEADALTKDAQQALRRTMEKFSSTCRFILSCNYPSKIIEPIQSRTVVFRFKRLDKEDLKDMLKGISESEGLELEKGAYDVISELSGGDARYAINLLQSASARGEKITGETVYQASSRVKPEKIDEMLKLALSGDFSGARKILMRLLVSEGLGGDTIIKNMHSEVIRGDYPEKAELINMIGECEFRMLEGATELIQLDALLAKMSVRGNK